MSKMTSHVRPALVLGALLCLGSLAGAEAPRHHAASETPNADRGAATLHRNMRKLWSDHVYWTREYVVSAIDGPPAAAQAAAERLMRNQDDIGAAIASFYGKAAGDQLTSLLKQHIQIAVDVVSAAKAGEKPKLDAANERWNKNADEIASFLSGANPRWPRQQMKDAMAMHLQTTTQEVLARLHQDYRQDVAAFDAVYDHILRMADVLADGIVQQFPARFQG